MVYTPHLTTSSARVPRVFIAVGWSRARENSARRMSIPGLHVAPRRSAPVQVLRLCASQAHQRLRSGHRLPPHPTRQQRCPRGMHMKRIWDGLTKIKSTPHTGTRYWYEEKRRGIGRSWFMPRGSNESHMINADGARSCASAAAGHEPWRRRLLTGCRDALGGNTLVPVAPRLNLGTAGGCWGSNRRTWRSSRQ
jgi:hypothetical protein